MPMSESRKRRIRNALNLAKNSTNPTEAARALQNAQRMMKSSNASESDVFIESEKRFTKIVKFKDYHFGMLQCIEQQFGVRCVMSGTFITQGTSLNFIGIAPQAELAAYAYDVIFKAHQKARNEYVSNLNNNCKRSTKIKRADSFSLGYLSAVIDKIDSWVMDSEHKSLLDKYMETNYPQLAKAQSKKTKVHDESLNSGYQKGRGFTLHRGVAGEEQLKLGVA